MATGSYLSAFFIVQLSHPYMTTRKNIALTRQTFVGQVTSLLFNILSSLVITFFPRSKHLLISSWQLPSAVILEPKKLKSVTDSIVSPFICHEVMGPDAMILVFCCFKLAFFTLLFHQEDFQFLFTFCHKGCVICISSAYLRLLIFLQAILIPACASSSPAFLIMYSAYKLNIN